MQTLRASSIAAKEYSIVFDPDEALRRIHSAADTIAERAGAKITDTSKLKRNLLDPNDPVNFQKELAKKWNSITKYNPDTDSFDIYLKTEPGRNREGRRAIQHFHESWEAMSGAVPDTPRNRALKEQTAKILDSYPKELTDEFFRSMLPTLSTLNNKEITSTDAARRAFINSYAKWAPKKHRFTVYDTANQDTINKLINHAKETDLPLYERQALMRGIDKLKSQFAVDANKLDLDRLGIKKSYLDTLNLKKEDLLRKKLFYSHQGAGVTYHPELPPEQQIYSFIHNSPEVLMREAQLVNNPKFSRARNKFRSVVGGRRWSKEDRVIANALKRDFLFDGNPISNRDIKKALRVVHNAPAINDTNTMFAM